MAGPDQPVDLRRAQWLECVFQRSESQWGGIAPAPGFDRGARSQVDMLLGQVPERPSIEL